MIGKHERTSRITSALIAGSMQRNRGHCHAQNQHKKHRYSLFHAWNVSCHDELAQPHECVASVRFILCTVGKHGLGTADRIGLKADGLTILRSTSGLLLLMLQRLPIWTNLNLEVLALRDYLSFVSYQLVLLRDRLDFTENTCSSLRL